MDDERDRVVARLVANLQQAGTFRQSHSGSAGEAAARTRLREWQAERLARTYNDLLKSERFGAAAAFFQSDLYGPKDFSARDADIARLLPLMTKTLPLAGLETVSSAMELDALSERLDAQMTGELLQQGALSIDGASYAAAYRKVGDRPGRERQITLISEGGYALDRLTRRPLIRRILRLMREPARLGGLGAIQEFLERGFDAFHKMGSAEEFIETIRTRETQLLEDLFAGRLPSALMQVTPAGRTAER
ncbi:MAG: hypothetical protein D4R84_17990 [Rhodocyclaceae bacterium]|nr:MAG: hypothetical protein D4R84_17990 [Rhodocyclaceae bacterium]